ncbi:MAG: hypothetical protein PHC80_08665, partial [Eubacteriales bacterium]|nr:hypothetical protein [Eubacteriales bacterium]
MKQRSTALRTDIAFLALLSLIFLGIIFVAIDADNIVRNGVILCGALIVLLLTYYTSQTTGLVLSAILAFLITAYTGFYALSTGTSIPISAFFWIL